MKMLILITNKLIIECEDTNVRNKIQKVIFTKNDDESYSFSLTKLLPIPQETKNLVGFIEIAEDWCKAVWGTKNDVWHYNVSESGETILMSYLTEFSPNTLWVEALCRYINSMSYHFNKNGGMRISVNYTYFKYPGLYGDIMKWTPSRGFNYMKNVSLINER